MIWIAGLRRWPSTKWGESVAGADPGGPWRFMNMPASVGGAPDESSRRKFRDGGCFYRPNAFFVDWRLHKRFWKLLLRRLSKLLLPPGFCQFLNPDAT